jgi:hypothetical protein
MTDREQLEYEILAKARIGLGPTAVESAQLRRSIDVAIAAGSGPHTPSSSPPAAPHSGGALSRWMMVSALAAATGAAGYGLGYRAGRTAPPVASVTGSAAVVAVAPPPASRALTAVAPPPPSIADGDGPSPERDRRPAPSASSSARKRTPADSLAEEVRAIRSIERALRDGQPGLGLALLRELDRAVPDGRLVEEREALSAIARCASGRVPLGLNLGDDFADRHPSSVYLRRVQAACGSEATDSDPAGN